MSSTSRTREESILLEWLTRHPRLFSVVDSERGSGPGRARPMILIERPSGKSLQLDPGSIAEVDLDRDAYSGASYVRLRLADGRRFALSHAGFVFQPDFTSTGPLSDCPTTACFRDYARLFGHLSHLVVDARADDDAIEPRRQALQVLMVLLAFLDGARKLGLEVGEEERRLKPMLEELERL